MIPDAPFWRAPLPDEPDAATFDALLARNARHHPGRLALADDPRRSRVNDTPPRRLTYAEAEDRVAALADFLAMLGLERDAVLAVDAVEAVDTVLVMLAAMRAGLVVAPVPPLWDRDRCVARLGKLAPAAWITTGTVDGHPVGARSKSAADLLPSLRQVYGFGGGLPVDVLDLETFAPAGSGGPPLDPHGSDTHEDALHHLATVTFAADASHPRSHAHWLAAGAALRRCAALTEGTTLLLPYALTGLTGIGFGLAPWLLAAGTLHLHHFDTLDTLAGHADAVAPDLVVLPAGLGPHFLARLALRARPLPALAAVWKDGHPEGGADAATPCRIIDVTVIDELAGLVERRSGAGPNGLRLGGDADALAGTEIRVEGRPLKAHDRSASLIGGTLSLRGAMLPAADTVMLAHGARLDTGLRMDEAGFVRTKVLCRLADGPKPIVIPLGRTPDTGLAPIAAADPPPDMAARRIAI